MRPIRGAGGVPVLHRVEVDVIDVPVQVVFVADQVFPVTPLPDAAFAPGDAARGSTFRRRKRTGESSLDLGPAAGVVRVTVGQSPYAMPAAHGGMHLPWRAKARPTTAART